MHIFCKTHHVFDFDHSTIIQHCFTIHASKYLMLIRFYNQCICPRRTVKNRFKIHLESTITGCKLPRFHIISIRNMECYIVQFVTFSIIKKHIFRCCCSVSKSTSDCRNSNTSDYHKSIHRVPNPKFQNQYSDQIDIFFHHIPSYLLPAYN